MRKSAFKNKVFRSDGSEDSGSLAFSTVYLLLSEIVLVESTMLSLTRCQTVSGAAIKRGHPTASACVAVVSLNKRSQLMQKASTAQLMQQSLATYTSNSTNNTHAKGNPKLFPLHIEGCAFRDSAFGGKDRLSICGAFMLQTRTNNNRFQRTNNGHTKALFYLSRALYSPRIALIEKPVRD